MGFSASTLSSSALRRGLSENFFSSSRLRPLLSDYCLSSSSSPVLLHFPVSDLHCISLSFSLPLLLSLSVYISFSPSLLPSLSLCVSLSFPPSPFLPLSPSLPSTSNPRECLPSNKVIWCYPIYSHLGKLTSVFCSSKTSVILKARQENWKWHLGSIC